jgi:hypothetical protein
MKRQHSSSEERKSKTLLKVKKFCWVVIRLQQGDEDVSETSPPLLKRTTEKNN